MKMQSQKENIEIATIGENITEPATIKSADTIETQIIETETEKAEPETTTAATEAPTVLAEDKTEGYITSTHGISKIGMMPGIWKFWGIMRGIRGNLPEGTGKEKPIICNQRRKPIAKIF